MIDGLKTLADNLSDRADKLLALNVETYDLLHSFNANGTGMIVEDSPIIGTNLSTVVMLDDTTESNAKYAAKFYDTNTILCGYNYIASYYGSVESSMYNSKPTSYKFFDINSLVLTAETKLDIDQRLCGRAYAGGALDFYSPYGGIYVMLKKVDSSFENETEVATPLIASELNLYDIKYKNRFLNTWVSTNAYISWATRSDIHSPITVETRSYDPSTGAQILTSSYQLPWLLYGGNSSTYAGEFLKTYLDAYSNIYFKYGDYLLMMLSLFGKRFLAIINTTDNTIYYIDADMFFLIGNIGHDTSIPERTDALMYIGTDGLYMPPTVYNLQNIADFMHTSGYFHFIVRATPNISYYMRFAY